MVVFLIIPLALVEYEMIIAKEAIYHLITHARGIIIKYTIKHDYISQK